MSICRVVFVYESIPIMYCFGFPCSLAQEFVFHRFPLSEDAANIGGLAQQTWGDPDAGDSSKVQGLLRNVQQLQATKCAFAAILADGSVLAWGSQASGGDSSNVQTQLRSVQKIQATSSAFAAIVNRWIGCCVGQSTIWW